MSNFSNLRDRLRTGWTTATAPKRAGAIGLSVAAAAGLLFAAHPSAGPRPTPIFRGVPAANVPAIQAALRGQDIPMQYDRRDGTIRVPAKDRREAAMTIEAGGFLATGRQAVEAELDRKLQQLDPVTTAAVTFADGNEGGPSRPKVSPTASVILGVKWGVTLSDDQVTGIIAMVANARSGLKPENVTLVRETSAPAAWTITLLSALRHVRAE